MHLLVSIDPEKYNYYIFAVTKKELWSCLASRMILREPSATNTRNEDPYKVGNLFGIRLRNEKPHSISSTTACCHLNNMVVIHMSLGACVHVSNAKRSVASGDSIAIKIV